MSIVYGLRLTCDLYLYYTVLALLGIADGRHAAVLALPTLLGVGAGIGYRNAGRGERARLLPLALGLLAGLLRPTNGEWTLAVPAAIYAVMYVRRNRRATDYYYAFERLKFSMIPLGAALGVSLFSGAGPLINVSVVPVGSVTTAFATSFESAGINQTRHEISLQASVLMRIIVPTGADSVTVDTLVPIAESIIVGQVPSTYVNVPSDEDALNLVP